MPPDVQMETGVPACSTGVPTHASSKLKGQAEGDKQAGRQADGRTERHLDIKKERHRGGPIDREADRK